MSDYDALCARLRGIEVFERVGVWEAVVQVGDEAADAIAALVARVKELEWAFTCRDGDARDFRAAWEAAEARVAELGLEAHQQRDRADYAETQQQKWEGLAEAAEARVAELEAKGT